MRRSTPLALAALVALAATGCGAARQRQASPAMAPLAIAHKARPKTLEVNHFQRDKVGAVSEGAIREILAAPVFLEQSARVGIVPVETGYELDQEVPVEQVTGKIARRLSDGNYFQVVSEVTTDWPGTRSVAGLREIATRYRAEYLLLYRHRFVDWERVNGWGWTYLAVLPAFMVPSTTMEHAGVLEATLFDVKTGTLLFTVYERISGVHDENMWHQADKRRHYKTRLLGKAADLLARQVEEKLQSLIAARPSREAEDAAVAQR